jgi:hypothetical protein
MRCGYCDSDFTPKTIRGWFCSAKCRKAAWQRHRQDALVLVEDQLTRALTRVRALRGSKGMV